MSKQNQMTAHQRAIMEISPLISFAAPIKQRAVLEVLYRKSIGFTVEFLVEEEELRVSFDFDDGLPITVNLAIADFEVEAIREILHDRITVHVSVVQPDNRLMIIAHLLGKDSPANDPKELTKFTIREDELIIYTGESLVARSFNDVVYGLEDDEDMVG